MNYFYTFIKADQFITVSGSGGDPKDIQNIEWTSSPGAAGVLKQMNNIRSVYSPTTGFVNVDDHKNNIYVHIAKFNNIYKDGWRFENSNVPAPASNSVEKSKSKQRVYVPASKHHKAYYRMQNVGSEATVEVDNIWDMTVKEFNVLMSSTRNELREQFISDFRYPEYEPHQNLQDIIDILPDFMSDMFTPDALSMCNVGYSLHEMAVTDAVDNQDVSPRVLKDYPDLAERHGVDISDAAIAAAPPLSDDPTALHEMGKSQYDTIIAGVKKDYDRTTESVSNADIESVYADEVKVVDQAAKTRARVYKNMPQHMQLGCTPDTITQSKYYEGIILAAKNNKDTPNSVKEQYPMIFTDIALNFAPTHDPDTNSAVNEVLTDIRDKMGGINYMIGDPNDRVEYRKRLKRAIKEVIGATGENVPTYFMGMSPEEEIAVYNSVDRLSNFLGPNIITQMKKSGYDVNIYYDVTENRPFCRDGNITLSSDVIRRSILDDNVIIVDDETIMHEYGHSIEHYAPSIQSECHDFLTKRTEGERLVMLSDAVVNSGYDSDEFTRIDNFKSAYIGKRYASGSTEILSMGMGYLSNEWDTTDLMMEDPEYLGFVIATVAGKVGFNHTEKMEKAENYKYFYTYIKDDEFIRVSGNGDPNNLTDIKWTSSPGAAGVLAQMNSINSVYTPTIGFVSINDYKNDIYVQIAKFGSIYKNGWRFSDTNLSSSHVAKSEVLAKGKTKRSVYVKGSGKRKPYWRVQEVGREEIDPKKIENIWDIPLDQFVRLVSGDKQLLKERYIDEHRYNDYEEHPVLKDLLAIAPDNVRYNNEGRLSFFDDPDVNIHTKSIYQTLRDGGHVPAYVLKDYPDVAKDFGIDISDMAIEQEATFIDDTSRERITNMPKAEYDSIVNSVKAAYDRESKHITDKMLKQDYEEELEDCKRSAKLRKRLFNKLPEHMQYGYTPDTIDARLHKTMVTMAHKYNIDIPTEVKAGYPTIYTNMPFSYESTGNTECDAAANDILTQIRDSLGPDDFDTGTKISEVIYDIIGAIGESVPIMCGVGIDTKDDQFIAESAINEVSASLISPDLMDQIKGFKRSRGPSRIMLTLEEGIRANQSGGVIHLSDFDRKTLAHEYGHAIDWMLPEINELSQAFLNNRTEGDPLIALSEIVPYGNYGPDEITRPDNFMSPYIGRHYDHSSSEVLSMGMGYMMSSESMMDMYEQDPEYLGYIVAVLSGRAKGAKVTKGPWSGSDEPGGFAPTNKGEIVEIDLSKLLNTSGLTRKRVLVRRKGEAPFWSTRWVHQGDTIKETVEAAGFELVAVEGEESEKVDIKVLVNEAIAAGKAAFEAGITMNDRTVPERDEIIKRSDGSVKQELDIRDAWSTGWHTANAAKPVPGLADDIATAEARDKAEMDISWDIINPSYEAGKAAFKRGIKSSGSDFGLIPILRAGNGTEATSNMVKKAWQRGWDEESKKAPEPAPRVTLKSLMEKALDAGKEAFVAGSQHNEIMNDPKMVEILGQSSNLMHQLKLRENWLKGWAQAKEIASADNFDTMPDVETESDVKTTSIPIADRVSGSKTIGGWSGTRPAVKVSDLQVGDIQLFTDGITLKIKEIRRSGKSYILTYEDYVNEETGKDWEAKRQGRAMVGVRVPPINVPDDFSTTPTPTPKPDPTPEPETKQLTAEDVMQPAYDAGADAFKRGIDIKGGANDSGMTDILLSIRHLPNYKQLEVMRRWIDGWQDAKKVATSESTSEYAFAGTPLADRIDSMTRMEVPGIGTTPAITVGNVQIGDRLQFPEGVFRIKGVVVKGKSSTMIFEETDDKGNNLKLKKQNRSWMAVEKTQLHPLGYIASPNKPGVPHWARTKETEPEFERKITTFSSEGFTPVKTVVEGVNRLQRDFMKSETETGTKYGWDYGLNLDGLKVSGINSIIKGFDKVLGKHGIKLDYIGWNKKKQKGLAYYASSIVDDYNSILFQKTATKGIKSRENRIGKNFMMNKDVNIANCERHLTYPELRSGDHDRERDKIELLKACDRWTVDASFDDMLAATAAHEASHAVYDVYKLKEAWARNLTYLVGEKMNRELKCASVSEYGMSSMSELFAEVGSAVAFDIPIDPDVKQAYLDTIGSIKQ